MTRWPEASQLVATALPGLLLVLGLLPRASGSGLGEGIVDYELASRLRAAGEAPSDAELAHLVRSLPAGSTGRERACEILVARYEPVIRSCVRRYHVPADLADELTQVGYLGLMKAISNFDPQIGASLTAYAQPCISGEIKRYFRDRRWQLRVNRPLQELRLQIRDATAALTQQFARAPTPAELAQHLHVSEEQIIQTQYASQAYHAVSLDAPLTGQDGTASLGDLTGQDDPALEHVINIESVHAHWADLDDQTQHLLTLRFYGNLTQEQIGKQLGVSQMQVSRLLRRALDYLRTCLTAPGPDPQRR